MNIEITSQSKNEADFKLDNVTVAEVLRAYLADNGASFAAWKREHPSKPLTMKIQSSEGTVAKAVSQAVQAIKKDCDSLVSNLKK